MTEERTQEHPALGQLRSRQVSLVKRIKEDREELARVEYAIRAIQNPHRIQGDVQLEVTSGGSIKNLRKTIIEYLKASQRVATTSDMTDALYSFSLDITESQLKRRLSVTASAMFKKYNPPSVVDSGLKNENREIYWALPTWMLEFGNSGNQTELKEQYLPLSMDEGSGSGGGFF